MNTRCLAATRIRPRPVPVLVVLRGAARATFSNFYDRSIETRSCRRTEESPAYATAS